MIQPKVARRNKKPHCFARYWINGIDPIGFTKIAARAGPSQIVQLRQSSTGFGDDMFNVKSRALERLIHSAIFATFLGADATRRTVESGIVTRACDPINAVPPRERAKSIRSIQPAPPIPPSHPAKVRRPCSGPLMFAFGDLNAAAVVRQRPPQPFPAELQRPCSYSNHRHKENSTTY